MANNQYVNKVQFGNNTLIDLTSDTVTAAAMLYGYIAHAASGATVTGTITTKTDTDVTCVNGVISVPTGYYASNVNKIIEGVELTAPESGTRSFYVTLPNDANDTVTLVFTVDAEGNSDVTEDMSAANGVSF